MFNAFQKRPLSHTIIAIEDVASEGLHTLTRHSHCSSISSHQELEKLPGFQDVAPSQRRQLFIDKIGHCSVIFDFKAASSAPNSKGLKLLALNELQNYVKNDEPFIDQQMCQILTEMFAENVFRPIPRRRVNPYESSDLDEDEPTLEVGWPHIQGVYELFLLVIESNHLTSRLLPKTYIDHNFMLCILELFGSEDPRERDILKATLHCLYRKFPNLRSFVRRSINNVFLQFTYESGTVNGIAELLEVLGSIISGLVPPLKKDYKTTLTHVLLPLHKPSAVGRYHSQLSRCVIQLLEKDSSLSQAVWKHRPPFGNIVLTNLGGHQAVALLAKSR